MLKYQMNQHLNSNRAPGTRPRPDWLVAEGGSVSPTAEHSLFPNAFYHFCCSASKDERGGQYSTRRETKSV